MLSCPTYERRIAVLGLLYENRLRVSCAFGNVMGVQCCEQGEYACPLVESRASGVGYGGLVRCAEDGHYAMLNERTRLIRHSNLERIDPHRTPMANATGVDIRRIC